MGIFVMIINYFHDLSVALLASNVIVVYLLGRYLDNHPDRVAGMADIFKKLSRVTYGALAFVLAGGAVRAFFFTTYEWNPAVGQGQVTALVIKHVLLVILTIAGIAGHVRYQRKYGSRA
jgi:hypothetical protein